MRINSYTKKDDETVSKRKSYNNIHTELAKKMQEAKEKIKIGKQVKAKKKNFSSSVGIPHITQNFENGKEVKQ